MFTLTYKDIKGHLAFGTFVHPFAAYFTQFTLAILKVATVSAWGILDL